ncbi:3-isopropylmalate dehydrogenase [Helicobacter sp.]|uniref:3-isopropylmalate dehydrogenase n=1 Tax=Helicobacter sp. TaxID=218 RepID=UPI0025C6F479|nr:3-isopropylmalate dehydrogenase [Helicobacter sp.]MCI5969273.1 3-isopropylmalate dehydrogenase [Helicobacter sp.]MDY2585528.1 3-isopropylmalate dehydrogenase [Helicobacter sp.]
MQCYKIAVIKGDGIGPEVINEALKVLKVVAEKFCFNLEFEDYLMGGIAYDLTGTPLPKETIEGCLKADATLFGAIGGEKWDNLPRELRPESGLLDLRKSLEVFANFRPAKVYDALIDASTLKAEVIEGVDILVVRELIGGIYFGTPKGRDRDRGFNTMVYSVDEVRRIAHTAFVAARKRKKKVCSVDKANVLDVSQLWREVVSEVAKEYQDIELSHMYVDNAAMQLIKNPKQFDVIVTGNLFGDILSDEASMLSGSIGLLPSASIGAKAAIYEPIHGSAPDIAGTGIANPIAAIASAAMMLRYSLGQMQAAEAIEKAIEEVLQEGFRTKDIADYGAKEVCNCERIGSVIAKKITKL